MLKSGLIIGAISFVLVLGSTLIHPFCAVCVGLFLGLAAGYFAGVFDKPISSGESIKKGAIAGAIAAALGLAGGIVGAVINALVVDPATVQSIFNYLGIPNYSISRTDIWTYQIIFGVCVGLFNIVWMAILGVAGGAIWYQIRGKNQPLTVMPPQERIPPSI